VTDQHRFEEKLSAWEREQERQKVEFTITERDLDASLRTPSPEVLSPLVVQLILNFRLFLFRLYSLTCVV